MNKKEIMKKILFTLILICLGAGLSAQSVFRKGIKVGDPDSPTVIEVDTIRHPDNGTDLEFYNGGTRVYPAGTVNRVYNVIDYGAVSDDGIEDGSKIRAAITAAVAASEVTLDSKPFSPTVYIPAGVWYLTDSIELQPYIRIKADPQAYIYVASDYTGSIYNVENTKVQFCDVSGGYYYSAGRNYKFCKVRSDDGTNSFSMFNSFRDMTIRNADIVFDFETTDNGWINAFDYSGLKCWQCLTLLKTREGVSSLGIDGHLFSNIQFQVTTTDAGLVIDSLSGEHNKFYNVHIWDIDTTRNAQKPGVILGDFNQFWGNFGSYKGQLHDKGEHNIIYTAAYYSDDGVAREGFMGVTEFEYVSARKVTGSGNLAGAGSVYGTNGSSETSYGVYGNQYATSGSNSYYGVYGKATGANTGTNAGVYGYGANGTTNYGVFSSGRLGTNSDMYLTGTGKKIDFYAGDITLTHSSNTLTLGGGDLALGANNLTMTGSIASDGSRVTKGWFTDIDVTNSVDIGDIAINDNVLKASQAMGSNLKAVPIGNLYCNDAALLVDSTIYWCAVYLTEDATITGASFSIANLTGNFDISPTADNAIGLYTESGGTLTRVAMTTDDDNLWKGATYTKHDKAFSSTYAASAGVLYIAFVYNYKSTETQAPRLYYITNAGSANNIMMGLTNSSKFNFTTRGSTLPASQAMSGGTAVNSISFVGLY